MNTTPTSKAFLVEARPHLTELTNASDATLTAIGNSACAAFAGGASRDDYRASVVAANPSMEIAFDHLSIASAATMHLCPQYR